MELCTGKSEFRFEYVAHGIMAFVNERGVAVSKTMNVRHSKASVYWEWSMNLYFCPILSDCIETPHEEGTCQITFILKRALK